MRKNIKTVFLVDLSLLRTIAIRRHEKTRRERLDLIGRRTMCHMLRIKERGINMVKFLEQWYCNICQKDFYVEALDLSEAWCPYCGREDEHVYFLNLREAQIFAAGNKA